MASIVPPYVLRKLYRYFEAAGDPERLWLWQAGGTPGIYTPKKQKPGAIQATVRDIRTGPGRFSDLQVLRQEGGDPCLDLAADEAYVTLGKVLDFYREAFGRESHTGRGGTVAVVVHSDRRHQAEWDPSASALRFRDGDNKWFRRWTGEIDIVAHEFTHAVVAATARLNYSSQTGALHESICDVMASLAKQWDAKQNARAADWLLGSGAFKPGVANGQALRSLRAPGTAFDSEQMSKDKQVANFRSRVSWDDPQDEVYANSGIGSHAFYLFATAVGGPAWEVPGLIWYEALADGSLGPGATFADFAAATVRISKKYGLQVKSDLSSAWHAVGVL